MNPEFQRNLWLEVSPHRLIAMPAVLLLIFVAAALTGDRTVLSGAAQGVVAVLLVLWGSRLAADSVLGEVVARTWDGQRMSAIGPWAMTWGKLLGSTIYAWYGALWCVPVFLLSGRAVRDWPDFGQLLVSGLFAQAVALLVSLLMLRTRPGRLSFQVSIAQLFGVLAVTPFQTAAWDNTVAVIEWGHMAIPRPWFLLGSEVLFLAWAVVGVYRLMRAELQFRCQPWAWLAFVLFAAGYIAGFDVWTRSDVPIDATQAAAARAIAAFAAAVALTYVAAFVEPKSPVRLRKWLCALATGQTVRALETTPAWTVSGAVALILAALAMVLFELTVTAPGATAVATPMVAAVVLFVARDIGLLYYLVLDGGARRGHLGALVYLAVLYGLMPMILTGSGQEGLLPIVVPTLVDPPLLTIVPPLLQALLAAWLVRKRWQAGFGVPGAVPPGQP